MKGRGLKNKMPAARQSAHMKAMLQAGKKVSGKSRVKSQSHPQVAGRGRGFNVRYRKEK